MKLHTRCAALFTVLLILSSNAFAIDQVILKSGAVVEGKILSEEPNMHVDIELVNGIRKRYEQSEIQNVQRDVPSNNDSHMNGNTSEVYIGAQLGMLMGLDPVLVPGTPTSFFAWGARAGVNVAQMSDFAKLALGLSYTNSTQTTTVGVLSTTKSDNTVVAQLLFRKVADTGFYFGGEVGMDFQSVTTTGSVTTLNTSPLTFGADVGYDYFFSSGFSMGPDLRYDYVAASTYTLNGAASALSQLASNNLKILLTATIHL